MSRSYRKPWGTCVCVRRSAHHDKTVAARSMRRAQNQALRDAMASNKDWDTFLIPERYECTANNVYGWVRDGRQRPLDRDRSQYNNPYAYNSYRGHWSEEKVLEHWCESQEWDDWFLAYASRK
jgi:hypothetical protein